MNNQTILTEYQSELEQFNQWISDLVGECKFMDLPHGVRTIIFKGEDALKKEIAFYEKLVDESAEEEYLPFADEDFLVDDIEMEELHHA